MDLYLCAELFPIHLFDFFSKTIWTSSQPSALLFEDTKDLTIQGVKILKHAI